MTEDEKFIQDCLKKYPLGEDTEIPRWLHREPKPQPVEVDRSGTNKRITKRVKAKRG